MKAVPENLNLKRLCEEAGIDGYQRISGGGL